MPAAVDARRNPIDPNNAHVIISRRFELPGPGRSTYCLAPGEEPAGDLRPMRRVDEPHLKAPPYGSRPMAAAPHREGESVNRERVRRLMRLMGLEGLFPGRRAGVAIPGAKAYPYPLRDRAPTRTDEVWSSDITHVPMRHGFMSLTAAIDRYGRYVLPWRPSNAIDGGPCSEASGEALSRGRPEVFTDRGPQFTSRGYAGRPEGAGVAVSRDGRGRSSDNVFVGRPWRGVKYEDIDPKCHGHVVESRRA